MRSKAQFSASSRPTSVAERNKARALRRMVTALASAMPGYGRCGCAGRRTRPCKISYRVASGSCGTNRALEVRDGLHGAQQSCTPYETIIIMGSIMIDFYKSVCQPYPGLRPFEPHENYIYFGREGIADRLIPILLNNHFLAITGEPGCGKSSLIRAGLLHHFVPGSRGSVSIKTEGNEKNTPDSQPSDSGCYDESADISQSFEKEKQSLSGMPAKSVDGWNSADDPFSPIVSSNETLDERINVTILKNSVVAPRNQSSSTRDWFDAGSDANSFDDKLLYSKHQDGDNKLIQGSDVHPSLLIEGVYSWRIAMLRPGKNPFKALAIELLKSDVFREDLSKWRLENMPTELSPPDSNAAWLVSKLQESTDELGKLLMWIAINRPSELQPLRWLIVIDQLEELFTYCDITANVNNLTAFLCMLSAACSNKEAHVYVVVTIEDEFVDALYQVQANDFYQLAISSRFALPKIMRPESIRQAIHMPLKYFSANINFDTTEEIIKSIESDPDQLPLLQYGLFHYSDRIKSTNTSINERRSIALDFVKVFDNRAEIVFRKLTDSQKIAAESVFCMITSFCNGKEFRRPQSLSDIAKWTGIPIHELIAVIEVYSAPGINYLQHGQVLNDQSIIDLTYDAIMRKWTRLNRWMNTENERSKTLLWICGLLKNQGSHVHLLAGNDLLRATNWWNPNKEYGKCEWQPSERWINRYCIDKKISLHEIQRYITDSQLLNHDIRDLKKIHCAFYTILLMIFIHGFTFSIPLSSCYRVDIFALLLGTRAIFLTIRFCSINHVISINRLSQKVNHPFAWVIILMVMFILYFGAYGVFNAFYFECRYIVPIPFFPRF